MQEVRHLGVEVDMPILTNWQRRDPKRPSIRLGAAAAIAELRMHAIALNVADLLVVATKLGTRRMRGVEIVERPLELFGWLATTKYSVIATPPLQGCAPVGTPRHRFSHKQCRFTEGAHIDGDQ